MKKMLAALLFAASIVPAMAANTQETITLSGNIAPYVSISPATASMPFVLGDAGKVGNTDPKTTQITFITNTDFQVTFGASAFKSVKNPSYVLPVTYTLVDVLFPNATGATTLGYAKTIDTDTPETAQPIIQVPEWTVPGTYVANISAVAKRNGYNDPAGDYAGNLVVSVAAK